MRRLVLVALGCVGCARASSDIDAAVGVPLDAAAIDARDPSDAAASDVDAAAIDARDVDAAPIDARPSDAPLSIDAAHPADAAVAADAAQPNDAAVTTDAATPPDARPPIDAAPPTDGGGPTGESCTSAIDLTSAAAAPGGVTVTDTTIGRQNDVFTINTCVTQIPVGADAIYKVTVASGHTLRATVTPTGWDAALYVTATCHNGDVACAVGADQLGTGPETLSLATAGTYYVIVDNWNGARGPYTLHVRTD
ncbi:MAG: hypothetical protein K8W52_30470 [Deltaproteobacteria bacterium]|nr:hypothetical protein [Deltaproteobacteria bacterium]